MSAGGALLSSLVLNKNNRYTQKPEIRGKYCARWTLKGIDLRTPSHAEPNRNRYWRLNCNCWDCSYCGPIKAKRYKAAIRQLATIHNLNKFLTLTLDPKKLPEGESTVRYLRRIFSEFRVYLFRKCKGTRKRINYIAVLEFHHGGGENDGVPHLHILLDTYIEQAWISSSWAALGGGDRVWIEKVSILNVARYLSKYLTKEMLLSAPKKTRRITSSRSITLVPRFIGPKHYKCRLRRESIEYFFEICCSPNPDGKHSQIADMEFDAEDFLEAFSVYVFDNSAGNTT